jgi:ISXO2 transposase-like protein
VAIAVEDRGEASGRVRMRRIPDVTKASLTDFVLDHIARGSEVRTDGWQGYFDVGRHALTHVVTNLSASGDPAHVVMRHVHRVASLVQRWLLGTHQGAVSDHQLDYYLDEFTFRFNRRRSRHRGCSSTGCWRAPWPPTPPLQSPHQQIRRLNRPRARSGERSG